MKTDRELLDLAIEDAWDRLLCAETKQARREAREELRKLLRSREEN